MSAALEPSTFATTIELILKTFPLEAALLTSDVALVVVSDVCELLPYIAATFTIFGFATIYSL
jgi:hypothetical protein